MPSSALPALLSLLAAITTTSYAHLHGRSLLSPVAAAQRQELRQRGLNAMTYEGCYSSSQGLTDQGSYTYQASGYCQPLCVNQNDAVLATFNGTNCYCGNQLPPASSKVSDSNCNTPCDGYNKENCGGPNFWSVYLSGISSSVGNADGSSSTSSSSSSSSSTPTTSSSTTPSPSVVTSEAPGHTILVTVPAAQSTSTSTPSASSKSSTNVAGVAAGVVVGVVGAAALIGGIFFYLRRRKQQQAEEEYKQAAGAVDFLRGGREPKLPQSAYSQSSDSRMDPTAGRRNSQGSIADEGDYSRRVLRVANPDSS